MCPGSCLAARRCVVGGADFSLTLHWQSCTASGVRQLACRPLVRLYLWMFGGEVCPRLGYDYSPPAPMHAPWSGHVAAWTRCTVGEDLQSQSCWQFLYACMASNPTQSQQDTKGCPHGVWLC